jgi:hypothetical protein
MEMHFDKATYNNVGMWECGNVEMRTEKSGKPLFSFTFGASFTIFSDWYGSAISTNRKVKK